MAGMSRASKVMSNPHRRDRLEGSRQAHRYGRWRSTIPRPKGYRRAADEIMAAVRELHARGGIHDVFGRLPDELSDAAEP